MKDRACARFFFISILFCWVLLVACSSETVYAPVTTIATFDHIPKNGIYRVQKNDTLYSIAWRYGLDYRYLAKINHFSQSHYAIRYGQLIHLRSTKYLASKSKSSHALPTVIVRKSHEVDVKERKDTIEQEPNFTVSFWHWPAQGPLIGGFSETNKGINIGGYFRDPIVAAAHGKVVYSGNGLRNYGNLIIIKHNSMFLSAYAHNSILLVKEGDWVKKGQKIAEMGDTRTRTVMLHFEIRRNGKPVNPLSYLVEK